MIALARVSSEPRHHFQPPVWQGLNVAERDSFSHEFTFSGLEAVKIRVEGLGCGAPRDACLFVRVGF